jgi:hypothetical protein
MSKQINSPTVASSIQAMETSSQPHKEFLGTCLWIGDHQSRWTSPIVSACQSAYAQVAIRCDVDAACERGCQAVTRIIVARIDSRPIDRSAIETLSQRHPSARKIEVRGPMSEAFFRCADPIYEDGIHPWNTAESILKLNISETVARGILIVAPDFDTAEPLLQMAEMSGAAATWMRSPDPSIVRGIEEIWWHDAGLGNQTMAGIADKIRSFGPNTRHLLISTGPLGSDSQEAIDHGFTRIVRLPGSIDALIGRFAPVEVSSQPIKMRTNLDTNRTRRAA